MSLSGQMHVWAHTRESEEVTVHVSPLVMQSRIAADGVNVFYRHAGPTHPDAQTVVLLHGFPSSSFMYRNLIPHLAAAGYRVIAPDLPGFGFTEVPAARGYVYTFANLAGTFEAFVDAMGLRRFVLYVFDHGAPTGLRYAMRRPDSVAAIVTQNGNAYVEGFGRAFWRPIEAYWDSGGDARLREQLRPTLEFPMTKWQYTAGCPRPDAVPPEPYHLDQTLLERRGNKEIQLDLFYDYRTNVALYPRFQQYLFQSGVPLLVIWGRNDPIFVPAGADAYRRHVKDIELHWLDAGHFALEGNERAVAELMRNFFDTYYVFSP